MPDSLDLLEEGETLELGPGLNVPADEAIELNWQRALLNPLDYNISVAHELDGLYDTLVTVPVPATEKPGSILWVLLTSGFFHRIRVEAVGDEQYYHIRFCEATMNYQGQLS